MSATKIIEEVFERDEQRRMQKVNEAQNSHIPGSENLAPPKRSATTENASLTAEEQIIRDAIFDVFDSADPDAPRFFFEGQHVPCANGSYEIVGETIANSERLDFADAVIRRARAIKKFGEEEMKEEGL